MDYFIIFVTTVTGLYFHWWLYKRIQRWTDRDLALSLAGNDPAKRDYMLARLQDAKSQGIKRKALAAWLEQAAAAYRPTA
jgi:5,10-methylene-tetrahydrofolate dehydrogenase/methenyl tetrahydrofolate cyclohydrolase